MKAILLFYSLLLTFHCFAQVKGTAPGNNAYPDTTRRQTLNEFTITASRVQETVLRSPVSIEQLKAVDARNMGAPSVFDAVENIKGVQVIMPSLGFKVINTRGFANTTNVRFAQLVDGIDNQAPHLGAPIANALGANELDIDKIEIIPGTASALYGMNSINGLANIRTKNPFTHQGLSLQQLTGVNHLGSVSPYSPQLYSQTNFRFAKAVNPRFAFKVAGAYTHGHDWVADNRTDLASQLNASTNLYGTDNPGYDEVNGYGNESPNRRTLTLGGKKYVVARTGYREVEIADYNLQNIKGDAGFFFRPKEGHELSLTYKRALLNNIYQRANRFRLQDYTLHQYAVDYNSKVFEVRSYLTQENTGRSYNLRSLAENLDRAFKSDNQWFSDYATAYNMTVATDAGIAQAHKQARQIADQGRYLPGTAAYAQKKNELVNINNWDAGAALRVKSFMYHAEGLIHWDKLFPVLSEKPGFQLLSGFDHRTYIIIPDGNYFINPAVPDKNLTYSKTGGFTQLSKDFFDSKLRLSATARADKADYFKLKFNPRLTAVYAPSEDFSLRVAYQSGYRFPSIFEGFSNVNSGGVKRIGGLRIMSDGIFENAYTKASIDVFQARVTNDVNTQGLTQEQAIEKHKNVLQKNPYSYLQPEQVRSVELGVKGLTLRKSLFVDVDFYYNTYNNFIAQVEANIPNTANPDSIAAFLYARTKQSRYRLWTNSKSKIYNYGGGIGLKYKYSPKLSFTGNVAFAELDRTEDKDGLEDGFNTPKVILNGSITTENIWKNLGAGATYRSQTRFDYVSFLVSGEVPAYHAVDAQVNYYFKAAGLVAKVGATNLLNKPYYSMLGGASAGGLYYLSLTWSLSQNQYTSE